VWNKFIVWLRTAQVNNWHLKVLSLVLALLTFYAIRGSTSFEFSFTVPLEVEVGKGVAILDQPKTVEVTFRGSQEDLRELDSRQVRAVVKPEVTDTAGSLKVAIGPADIVGHAGVRVTHVRPDIAIITFDHEMEKMFRVLKPQTVGTPAGGKVEIDYTPQYVKISGPRRWLQNREVVETEPVDIGGCAESFLKRVHVLSPSDTGVVKIEPSEITVTVSIVGVSVSRELTNTAVRAVFEAGITNSVSFEPQTVTVSLHGREQILRGITADSVSAFVDCVGMDRSKSYELPVSVHLPAGVDVTTTVEPQTVKVVFGTARRR
jgi:YbbR domain-containing protein